jgi:O-antigen ligase
MFGTGYLSANYYGIGMQAHNSYISILFSFGLLGFLVYSAFLFNIYKSLSKSYNKNYLILFFFLIFYGFALEPYHITEGMLLFCFLQGVNRVNCCEI